MNHQTLFANSLKKVSALTAIAIVGSLLSLPALAGSTSQGTPKPTSATEAAPSAKPVVDTPSSSPSGTSAPTGATEVPGAVPNSAPTGTPETPSAAPNTTTPQATTGTIVDIAASNSSFETLVAAAKAAGLTDVLSSQGPYTVFAPTNEAFAALPKGTVESLLKPENKNKLRKVLAYHVIPGSVESSAIKPGQVKTVEGKSINVRMMGNRIMVNNATVTGADIKASNGVIHAIDKVILPPDL